MIIGVPKEIKNNENRVGMTPSGVAELVKRGHTVYIQHTAGENSGFQDEAYTAVGAQILPTMEETYAMAQMIVKVKEPIAPEYRLIRKGQLLFTYFHFASDRELTLAMIENGSVCLAYAQMAAGLGADVTIADINLSRLRYLSETLPKNVKTLYASEVRLKKELPDVDLVVGSVLIPGDKAPHLITRDMLKMMQPGTVLVDVAIDQGGCFETSHPTTHSEPTYVVDGIVHYAVANIPGAVPYTSTLALTNATLPYVIALANKGWRKACKEDPALALGLNVVEGKVVYRAIADVFGLKYEQSNLE